MVRRDLIQAQVADYYKSHPIGRTANDAFAAWWISKTFQLSPLDANARCEGAKANLGLDGFFLEEKSRSWTLHIVRSLMTDNRADIKAAITGFEKLMPQISPWLKGKTPDIETENNPLSRMLGALRDNPRALRALKVSFYVLHMNDDPAEILWNALQA